MTAPPRGSPLWPGCTTASGIYLYLFGLQCGLFLLDDHSQDVKHEGWRKQKTVAVTLCVNQNVFLTLYWDRTHGGRGEFTFFFFCLAAVPMLRVSFVFLSPVSFSSYLFFLIGHENFNLHIILFLSSFISG